MSERVQRGAVQRREAAKARERAARDRAEQSREMGEQMTARRHERSADAQAEAADSAERQRLADVAIEGEMLGEPTPAEVTDLARRRGGATSNRAWR